MRRLLTVLLFVFVSNPALGEPGLKADEIMPVIRANLISVRRCYEILLETHPAVGGKMHTTFIVSAKNGKVKSAVSETEGTIKGRKKFESCVLKEIRKWKFPKPRGKDDVTVNYPFVFNPN